MTNRQCQTRGKTACVTVDRAFGESRLGQSLLQKHQLNNSADPVHKMGLPPQSVIRLRLVSFLLMTILNIFIMKTFSEYVQSKIQIKQPRQFVDVGPVGTSESPQKKWDKTLKIAWQAASRLKKRGKPLFIGLNSVPNAKLP